MLYIVVPVYREAARISCYQQKLQQLSAVDLPHHMVLVDDGCPESSGTLLKPHLHIHHHHHHLLFLSEHRGKGAAVREGLRWCVARSSDPADVFVYIDFDCSSSLEHVVQLLEPVMQRRAHLSIASRRSSVGKKKGNPNGRLLLNRLRGIVYPPLSCVYDMQVGYKAMSRQAAALLAESLVLEPGYAFDFEIAFLLHRSGLGTPVEVDLPWTDTPQHSNVWADGKGLVFHEIVTGMARVVPQSPSWVARLTVDQLDEELQLWEAQPRECHYDSSDPFAACSARQLGEKCPLTVQPALHSDGGIVVMPTGRYTFTDVPEDNSILRNVHAPFEYAGFERRNDFPVSFGTVSDAFTRAIRVVQPQNMVISMAGSAEYRLPRELAHLEEVVQRVADAWQFVASGDEGDSYYCYLSVSDSTVPVGCWQRRAHLHSDGFQSAWITEKLPCDISFTVTNCLPTLYYQQQFSCEGLDPAVHNFFRRFESELHAPPVSCQRPFEVTMMDAYTLHRSARNDTGTPQHRVFLRFIYSKHRWDREGNARNPMFHYNWPSVHRDLWDRLK